VAAALALLVAACGDDAPAVDTTSPTAVFDAAMAALSKSDLNGLWPLLSPSGKQLLENDLRALQATLRDEATGADVLAAMRKAKPGFPVELFERARTGTIADVWHYFLLAKPRPATPKRGAVKLDPTKQTVTIEYEDSTGTLRPVTLRRDGPAWRIEHIAL
jgi:hypothetical protein